MNEYVTGVLCLLQENSSLKIIAIVIKMKYDD
jgi:hypothetical protein